MSHNIVKTVAGIYYTFENTCLVRANLYEPNKPNENKSKSYIKIIHSQHFATLPVTLVKETLKLEDDAIGQNKK